MGKIVQKDQPCLLCTSSDARQVYDDGGSHCFSCGKHFFADNQLTSFEETTVTNKRLSLSEIQELKSNTFHDRKISKFVTNFFEVKASYDEEGEIDTHYYPYGESEITSYKIRKLPKEFSATGKLDTLFGQSKFNGGKQLIITEGELDALSVAQAWYDKHKTIYPVVSISGATNLKPLLTYRDWIRNFGKVVIWFDNDEAGKKAAEEAAKIIGADKVYIAKTSEKDASDTLAKYGDKGVLNAIYDASRWSPSGLVSSADTWDIYKEEQGAEYIPYPEFAGELNNKLYGRRLGSITMLTSGTGMGKTSFVKEDQYHLLKTTEDLIGICSLEESVGEAVKNIMALEANQRIQLPDVEISEEEERKLWEATMGTNRFVFLDHQGSLGDESLISKMEYMALMGCKYIYLDHITIAVSESEDGKVNTAIDKMMSDLLKLAKRHNIWIGVVSHLRKTSTNQKSFEEGAIPSDDDLKGSGSLKQVPMQILAISRNKMETDVNKRNTSYLWILKDRFTGRTGPAGSYLFNEQTGRLQNNKFVEESFDL
jgi:twinkle protein